MDRQPFTPAYILTGPTGSGKSQLSLRLAELLEAEIVSADSMALYRRMDILTAKPSRADQQRVRHHLLDQLEPWESASVAWWLEKARECCVDIQQRGKRVLIVGGTPLYLKAILYGLFDGPPADAALRARLEAEADQADGLALHQRLAAVDPASARRLHPNDRRRLIRALEVWELTGRPLSQWQGQWAESKHLPLCHPLLWLDLPREELYGRIDARVLHMVEQGLVDEVRALRELAQPLSREAAQAVGVREISDYLDGKHSLATAIEQMQTRTRQFAKRQLTWFRHLPGLAPVSEELTFVAWGLTMNQKMLRTSPD